MSRITVVGRALRAAAVPVLLVLVLSQCSDLPLQPEQEKAQDLSTRATFTESGALACAEGTLSSGALYRVCVNPDRWNRDVVVFIPGYRDPAREPGLPGDFSDTPVSLLFTDLGYAFASTSFHDTGLIEPDTWIGGDLIELVRTARDLLAARTGRTTRHIYQTGGSQGGLGTVKAVEEFPHVFSGGLAACGPIGDYQRQIEYVAEFRLFFDYFFAGVIDGWPVWWQDLGAGDPGFVDPGYWPTAEQQILAALDDPSNADRIQQVLDLTGAPTDPNEPQTVKATALSVLWYSFRGTNNAIERLDGLPFENLNTVYRGSRDDAALNEGVERFRFTADAAKLARLRTSGRLRRPLVTMHTTGDPVVPVWHQNLYRRKLSFFRRFLHTPFTIDRYGHCEFTDAELLAAFAVLVLKVTGHDLLVFGGVLEEGREQTEFLRLSRQNGANPRIVPR